jgi:hypothetical protein
LDAEPAEAEPPATLGQSAAAAEPAALWQQSLEAAQLTGRYVGHGDSLTLRYAPTEANGWLVGLAAAVAIGLLAAGAVALVRRGTLWQGFMRWPYAFGVALGLAWWLFLWPSALGLVIVLVVLTCQFLPRGAAA